MNKPFCRDLYNKYDGLGINVSMSFLMQQGYKMQNNDEAFKSHDYIVEKGNKLYKIEVEVARSWVGLNFPYKAMTVPYRKRESKADFFFQINNVGTALICCPMKQILNSIVITKDTVYTQQEKFFSIPIEELTQYYKDDYWYYSSL